MNDDWRNLRVGDRIRFVNMPTEFSRPGYFVHRDTLRVYRRLIERRRPVRVAWLEDCGEWTAPWIRCQFRRMDGRIEYHSLMINHDGWVRVKHRPRRSP
jgi:hypothetical protein